MRHRTVSPPSPILLVSVVLPLLLLGVACGGSDPEASGPSDADPAGEATPNEAPSETPTPPAEPDASPTTTADPSDESDGDDVGVDDPAVDTPARRQLEWLLTALNAGTPPTVAELEARFAPSFLAVVPVDELVTATAQIVATTPPPFTLVSVDDERADGTALVATIAGADDTTLVVTLEVEPDEPHRFESLLLAPGELPELPGSTTIEEIDASLAELGASSGLGVYDVTDGECRVLHELRADEPVVLGSTFKLWILAELAHRIEAGEASWDEPLAVVDEHKSSPDGQIFPLPAGTERTLREYALLMISISDNSATDHLLARLGRENVEAALDRIGVARHDTAESSGNVPMLSTGALFQLKFIAAPPNTADWRAADEAGRRALLAELDAAVLPWVEDAAAVDTVNADGVPIDEPRDLDLEWFATPRELCATMTHLAELAERPGLEPVADILEAGRGGGLPFGEQWTSVRFKGGSEPGVVAGAWWFERDDGRRIVVAGGISDPERAVDELAGAYALASAIALVD